jgi:hypothetical protein
MAMLLIVLSVASPSLSQFFRGRHLDSEARRFLALTHYGQSRAVAEGQPIVLWLDAQQRTYGLEAEATYTEDDRKAVQFDLNSDLKMEVQPPAVGMKALPWKRPAKIPSNAALIRFTPDGFIGEASPEWILFREGEDSAIEVAQSRNRLSYEIQTNRLQNARR